jgi:hypothetical protein
VPSIRPIAVVINKRSLMFRLLGVWIQTRKQLGQGPSRSGGTVNFLARVPVSSTEPTVGIDGCKSGSMARKKSDLRDKLDLEAEAIAALEEARAMPPGPERTEAMKKAGILRNAADLRGLFFAKRGRPAKS